MTRAPLAQLVAARQDLRRALEHYSAALLEELGLPSYDPTRLDVVANLLASDDAARRAATVAGVVVP